MSGSICPVCGIVSFFLPIPFAWIYYKNSKQSSQTLKLKGAAAIWGISCVVLIFILMHFFGSCSDCSQ